MKTLTAAMRTHLQSEVTTLCTCLRIVRQDGLELGFTTHDTDLTIDGLVYETANGFDATAISSAADMSVDNMDIVGVLDSDKIKVEDIRNRLFDLAKVYVFEVNYENLAAGKIPLRRGWFGEAVVAPNGQYSIELRGMLQALLHENIEVFTPECRADFCDSRCKLSKADFEYYCAITALGTDRYSFSATNIPEVATLPTTLGAHKHWRVILETLPGSTAGGFAEFRAWDQEDDLITGGTAKASSEDSDTYKASRARDENTATRWRTEELDADDIGEGMTPVGEWWRISFSTAKDIKLIAIRCGAVSETPTAFQLHYTDDDPDDNDAVWTLAKACSGGSWTKVGQEAVWALGSDTSDPINVTSTPTDIPPPYEGTSTYIGGSVQFLSGQNTGMTLEVIDFDDATNTVTMFDAPYYPLAVGDLFKIAQGCPKTPAACKLYNNYVNFRGEPDVPGQDEYLWYPDAKS
ncbi:F5/8 type C domain protein [Sphingobium phage Lacusarx]|uniref:F5/8 type C domain protein n=1 Tax=Sphingobium phage Lacusarx TaxID=1980139 RepID=A0A1W6DX02_9CAUD|nr:tail assembly protein [Sphingobium phage Lacusarx]ARK07421.1 F5/8 type C domain protein [Sphingobium phage Lacusarx]